jgi:hypothetical protein
LEDAITNSKDAGIFCQKLGQMFTNEKGLFEITADFGKKIFGNQHRQLDQLKAPKKCNQVSFGNVCQNFFTLRAVHTPPLEPIIIINDKHNSRQPRLKADNPFNSIVDVLQSWDERDFKIRETRVQQRNPSPDVFPFQP